METNIIGRGDLNRISKHGRLIELATVKCRNRTVLRSELPCGWETARRTNAMAPF